MTREDKTVLIEELSSRIKEAKYFYITDHSTLSVARTNQWRRTCFEQGITVQVAKNTIIKKAMERAAAENNEDYSELYGSLKGFSALIFSEVGNLPAKTLKKFRGDAQKPGLKAAYIESAIYVGDNQLDALTKIKSKEELLGDLLGLLQSPIQNLLGAMKSGGNTIHGLLQTLEARGE
jgi:large subunit ribosomal protein L10